MIKKESLDILEYINEYYGRFEVDQKKLDAWHRILKNFEFVSVMENLELYVLGNEYPPKIKDLVQGLVVNEKYNIPGIEETKKIIEGYQVPKEQRASKERVAELLKQTQEKIRGLKNDY